MIEIRKLFLVHNVEVDFAAWWSNCAGNVYGPWVDGYVPIIKSANMRTRIAYCVSRANESV